MLAGNLASIGVGAIIATVSSLIVCVFSFAVHVLSQLIMLGMQWPDNFDWETTRAINKPSSVLEKTNQEKLDSDSDNRQADSYDSVNDELDHVALNKAFKFAATSSLTLVSFLTHRI